MKKKVFKTFEEQKEDLTVHAKRLFSKGESEEEVYNQLKIIRDNLGYSKVINIDAIQYLANPKR